MSTVFNYAPVVMIFMAVVVLAYKAWNSRDTTVNMVREDLELEYVLFVKFTDGVTMSVTVDSPSGAQTMLNRFAFAGVESAHLTENGITVAFMNASGILVRVPTL